MGIVYAGNQTLLLRIVSSNGQLESGIGFLVSANFFGTLLTVLVFGMIADRVGKRKCAMAASVFVFLGLAILGFANNFALFLLAFALIGCGMGGMESMVVSLCEDNNRERAGKYISILNMVFCIGAVLAPPLVSLLIPDEGFHLFYIVTSVFAFGLFIAFSRMKRIDKFAVTVKKEKADPLAMLRFFKNPAMLLCILSMFIYIASECTVVFWSDAYFVEIDAAALSAWSISIFWFSMIVGRFVVALIRDVVKILPACFLIGGIGTALITLLPDPYLKMGAIFLTGLAFGPIYGGLCFFGGHQYPERSGAAYSTIVFAAGIGGTLSQPLVGFMSEAFSIGQAYMIAAVASAVMAPVIYSAIVIAKKRRSGVD